MVKVKVEQGWLEGEVLGAVTGDIQYYSFKGIPYAEPPLGKLRFKAPLQPVPWQGIREAKNHGPMCPQMDIFSGNLLSEVSEDCLYLNVYSPDLKPKSPLPVMFFIHGGAYKSGCGNVDEYGPDFLVNHGVIVVTINYRLEVLGFLCLDSEEVPGNAGLKDQVAALKWVNKNISNFGGDLNNVTVMGESAGGAATFLHIISPMSKGLFNRAIPMSGSPINDFTTPFKPQQKAFKLCKQLGLETYDPTKALSFLQSVPVEKLINVNPALLSFEEFNNLLIKMFHFVPVVEKHFGSDHFLTENPLDALKNKRINYVDILFGVTSEELLLIADNLEHFIEIYSKHNDLVVPATIMLNCRPETVLEVSKKVYDYYFDGKAPSMDKAKQFITFCSHNTLVRDILRFISHIPKVGKGTRYMYTFSCTSNRNVYGKRGLKYGIEKASHLDDLMYLFDAKKHNFKIEKNTKEYELVNIVCTVFTNFAKFGNPTPNDTLGAIWPEYDSKNQKYIDIGDKLTLQANPEAKAMEFWKNVFEYAGLEF